MDPELIEIRLLATAIYERYGYDFRQYAAPSLGRRFSEIVSQLGLSSLSELQHKLLYDPALFYDVLHRLTITVSDFFRDPGFWKLLREAVVPYLRTFHSLKFWSAGCSSGQEAFSLAILLKEEGLLDRSIIHATDINPQAIEDGKRGSYPLAVVQQAMQTYRQAGGIHQLLDHFEVDQQNAILKQGFRAKVLFNHHNLATESSFGEMNLILCRNTMIYFQTDLKERVLDLINESLAIGGYLGIGDKESLSMSDWDERYEEIHPKTRIYRKL